MWEKQGASPSSPVRCSPSTTNSREWKELAVLFLFLHNLQCYVVLGMVQVDRVCFFMGGIHLVLFRAGCTSPSLSVASLALPAVQVLGNWHK